MWNLHDSDPGNKFFTADSTDRLNYTTASQGNPTEDSDSDGDTVIRGYRTPTKSAPRPMPQGISRHGRGEASLNPWLETPGSGYAADADSIYSPDVAMQD